MVQVDRYIPIEFAILLEHENGQTYPQWDLAKADKINNFLGKRFSFPKEDAGEIARRFSLFGFKNGGKIKS